MMIQKVKYHTQLTKEEDAFCEHMHGNGWEPYIMYEKNFNAQTHYWRPITDRDKESPRLVEHKLAFDSWRIYGELPVKALPKGAK